MFDLQDIKDSMYDLTHEKPLLFTVIVIVVFLFFAGLIILMIQTTPVKKVPVKEAEPFTQDAPVIIPDSPDIEKDYYPARITENQWQKEEVNKWFTYPEEETLKELEKANNKIVDDITGAAP